MSQFSYPLLPLKRVATINNEALGENTDPDYELQYIDIGNVNSNGEIQEITTYRFENAPSRARRIVRDGDVIISTVRTYLQAITQITNPPENLIVSTGFAVVRPVSQVLDTGYCKYALREPVFLHEVVGRSVGVSYPAITSLDLADIPIFVPPIEKQYSIANYLDRETGRIDSLIAAKEYLLELLAEKRRAIITLAVTRGLNPDAPMRDSGMEWLGKIPSHWVVAPLKAMAEIIYGLSQPPEYHDSGIPFLRATNVQRGKIARGGLVFVREDDLPISRVIRLKPKDIIVVRSGAYTGDSAIIPNEWENAVAGYDMVLRVMRYCLPEFVAYALLSTYVLDFQMQPMSLRAAQPHLNAEELGSVVVVFPDEDEQEKIIKYINTSLEKLDKLSLTTRQTIHLLHERRSALIAAAVSGQIDIKG